MKKLLFTMVMLVVMAAGVMMLSAFTTPKQVVKSECSVTETQDNWKLFRENVPYCDGDKGTCEGYGYVWINNDTYQVAFSITQGGTKYDLSEYTGKDGYNMRFWHSGNRKYYYISIYIPSAAWEY